MRFQLANKFLVSVFLFLFFFSNSLLLLLKIELNDAKTVCRIGNENSTGYIARDQKTQTLDSDTVTGPRKYEYDTCDVLV